MAEIRKAFVCGYPVEHSRSPIIHNYWLKHHRLNGNYVRLAVSSENIEAFLESLESRGLIGGNITLPHKEIAFKTVDQTDSAAEKIGAINTVWLENSVLHGGNTDGYGFLANLDQQARSWDHKDGKTKGAVLLGAGGASRAIVHSLQLRGFSDIRLVNRTIAKAQQIARQFAPGVTAHNWQELPTLMVDAYLLINTTSLGMAGKPPLTVDLKPLPDHCLVTDIVYVPLETPLLRLARQRALETVDGLGMLLHQAVPGFEKWFGIRPQVTPALRQLVIDDMMAGL